MATTSLRTHNGLTQYGRPASMVAWLVSLVALALVAHVTVRVFTDPTPQGDELRYLEQATYFAKGDPMYAEGIVKNPPLYPAMLSVLLKLGVPAEGLAYLNIAMMVIASGVMFVVLCRFLSLPKAAMVSSAFTLYPPNLMLGSRIMTEPLAVLIVLLVCLQLVHERSGNALPARKLVVTAALLALLALTKPVFAYVFVVACLPFIGLAVITTGPLRIFRLRLCLMLALALTLCTPYLAFTYQLTGKHFSWVTSDAEHVYWMSIGGEDVWGSWLPADEAREHPVLVAAGVADELDRAARMDTDVAAAYLGELAKRRISESPQTYLRNVVANGARLLFNYPFSFRPQSLMTYGYILPNMMLYLAMVIGLMSLPMTARHQNEGMTAIFVLCLIYLCGNLPVSSAARQGVVVIGPFLLWTVYQSHLLVKLGLLGSARPPVTGGMA